MEKARDVPAKPQSAATKSKKSKTARGASSSPSKGKDKSGGSDEVAGVRLTHPDRVLWADQGLTKRELAEFYVGVADWVLPHVVDRPLTLLRCPSGTEKSCFVQRHSWAGFGDHIHRDMVRDESGEEEEVIYVSDVQGLVSLVQASVLEVHVWGSTISHLEQPDRLVFDFDPDESVDWARMIEAAGSLRERLKLLNLESFLKVTGGKGLHVVVPLTPKDSWETTSAFARALAQMMEADEPARYTTNMSKRQREGKIFVDYLRNNRSATAIAPYSTRARESAPVSVPVSWQELTPQLKPNGFTVENLQKRLKALRNDPWAEIGKVDQVLPDITQNAAKKK